MARRPLRSSAAARRPRRALTALTAVALLPALSAQECSDKVRIPEKIPDTATEYNGIALPELCYNKPGPYNVYAIGDWGGLMYGEHMPPVPADKRSKLFPSFARKFVLGVDDRAQLRVAAEMRLRASLWAPDYVLNVGDNFYWGGVKGKCGEAPYQKNASSQWLHVFEQVYWGPGLEDKPWFGVLGNHDFGGYKFTAAWENVVGYTWGGGVGNTRRWVNPALYYSQKVSYPGFSVLYLMVDTNAFETWAPEDNEAHNICGKLHNGEDATCSESTITSIWQCKSWFWHMMEKQWQWVEDTLSATNDWDRPTFQVVVTHFPPTWGQSSWKCIAERYGVDLFITGHVHKQRLWGGDEEGNAIPGSCTVITGGGGGITSEDLPSMSGRDSAYGFVHITFSKAKFSLEGISHTGILRKVIDCPNRGPVPGEKCHIPHAGHPRTLIDDVILPSESEAVGHPRSLIDGLIGLGSNESFAARWV